MKTEEFRCYFCKKALKNVGISLNNPEKKQSFRFMPRDKSACIECYIDNAVKQCVKKHLKLKDDVFSELWDNKYDEHWDKEVRE